MARVEMNGHVYEVKSFYQGMSAYVVTCDGEEVYYGFSPSEIMERFGFNPNELEWR